MKKCATLGKLGPILKRKGPHLEKTVIFEKRIIPRKWITNDKIGHT